MKTELLAFAALAALALGTASANAAAPTAPGAEIGPEPAAESGVAPAGYWQYREFWRGNCKYYTLYVTDGYRWSYRWRRTCY